MPAYTLRGVEVQFPYDAYQCQLEYMEKVLQALQEGTNALLESPTGTGKTLCLLCATLAWREDLKKKHASGAGPSLAGGSLGAAPPGEVAVWGKGALAAGLRDAYSEARAAGQLPGQKSLPTIIYSSRTHSQLAQVMRELKSTAYKPRTCVVGSRSQQCLHPQVSKLSGQALNQACGALVVKSACQWHRPGVERFLRENPDFSKDAVDIEDLSRLGQSHRFCPFYLSRDLAADADVVFMPYNYLVDGRVDRPAGIQWENAVLIFDEAHNVEGVCSDSSSFDLPAAMVANCIAETQQALEASLAQVTRQEEAGSGGGASNDGRRDYRQLAGDLRTLRSMLQALESGVAAALKAAPGAGPITRPGLYLFEMLKNTMGLDPSNWPLLSKTLADAVDLLSADAAEEGRRSKGRASSHCLHELQRALSVAFDSLGPVGGPLAVGSPPAHLGFRVCIHKEKAKSGFEYPTLSYWCFNPGMAMQRLKSMKVGSILLTSGTLAPLDSFAAELQLPFPVRLENPHVIEKQQVWIGTVPVGPQGVSLNSSYQNRERPEYKADLGYLVVNLARIVPDGLLVFFPSYGQLASAMTAWKSPPSNGGLSIWERILQHKLPVVEPRESAAFPAAAEDFRCKLDDPSGGGAVFFAVCRGKVSEGLDFSDRAGRAVVITGIPFANATDPKIKLKKEVLNDARATSSSGAGTGVKKLTGDQWYVQQASRAVNQAMGRVIRHVNDYGAIILADERFTAAQQRNSISKWLRDLSAPYPNFGAASSSLTQFFKEMGSTKGLGLRKLCSGGDGSGTRRTAFTAANTSARLVAPGASKKAGYNSGGGSGAVDAGGGGMMDSLLRSLMVPTASETAGLPGLPATSAAKAAGGSAGGHRKPDSTGYISLLGALNTSAQHQGQQQQQQQHRAGRAAAPPGALAAGSKSALLSALDGLGDDDEAQRPQHGQHQRAAGHAGGNAPSQTARGHLGGVGGVGGRPSFLGHVGGDPATADRNFAAAAPAIVGPSHLVQLHQRRSAVAPGAAAASDAGAAAVAPPPAGPSVSTGGGGRAAAAEPAGFKQGGTGTACEPGQLQQQQPGCQTKQGAATCKGAEFSSAGGAAGGAAAGSSASAEGSVSADGGSGAALSSKARSHALLQQLREQLPQDAFAEVKRQLIKYRERTVTRTMLLDTYVSTLRAAGAPHLLPAIAPFLPKADKEWFTAAIRDLGAPQQQQRPSATNGSSSSASGGGSGSQGANVPRQQLRFSQGSDENDAPLPHHHHQQQRAWETEPACKRAKLAGGGSGDGQQQQHPQPRARAAGSSFAAAFAGKAPAGHPPPAHLGGPLPPMQAWQGSIGAGPAARSGGGPPIGNHIHPNGGAAAAKASHLPYGLGLGPSGGQQRPTGPGAQLQGMMARATAAHGGPRQWQAGGGNAPGPSASAVGIRPGQQRQQQQQQASAAGQQARPGGMRPQQQQQRRQQQQALEGGAARQPGLQPSVGLGGAPARSAGPANAPARAGGQQQQPTARAPVSAVAALMQRARPQAGASQAAASGGRPAAGAGAAQAAQQRRPGGGGSGGPLLLPRASGGPGPSSAAAAAAAAVGSGARRGGGGGSTSGAAQQQPTTRSGPSCPVCKKPAMESPFVSTCGHSACYTCWMKVLPSTMKCPVCKTATRKRNLTKKFFA